jgi:hypothetical protein
LSQSKEIYDILDSCHIFGFLLHTYSVCMHKSCLSGFQISNARTVRVYNNLKFLKAAFYGRGLRNVLK